MRELPSLSIPATASRTLHREPHDPLCRAFAHPPSPASRCCHRVSYVRRQISLATFRSLAQARNAPSTERIYTLGRPVIPAPPLPLAEFRQRFPPPPHPQNAHSHFPPLRFHVTPIVNPPTIP